MKRHIIPMFGVVCACTAGCASAALPSYATLSSEYRERERSQRAERDVTQRALTAPNLTRGALIRAVLQRNPSLEAARQGWRAALARYRQAGSLEDPMLMASFAPLSVASQHRSFGYEVELSQRIPLGGKLAAAEAIAAAETQLAQSDHKELRLKLALIASELYDDYGLSVRSLAIQSQHAAVVRALKDNAATAYASGHATLQDALLAEAELAQVEYQQSVYVTQRDVSVAQLNALLHRAADAALPEPETEPEPRGHDQAPDVGALDQLLAQRPDIVSARARVRAASARVSASERAFYPDLTLQASYNSMWQMPEHRFMAGVSLNVPLQRTQRYGAVDEASAMRASSQSEAQSMTDAARAEAAVALRQLQQARNALQLYEQRLVPLARQRIEAARAGFSASQGSFMSVLEAERGLRAAELELELARGELGKRSAALDRALGRAPAIHDHEVAP
jgi:cobalt-zinc-cadmium efflux system outer membrane protein